MVFGEGLLGPAAIVYCCAGGLMIPFLYMGVIGLFRGILRNYAVATLNVILAFGLVGYLFGDFLGIVAALLVAFPSYSLSFAGPRSVGKKVKRMQVGTSDMGTIFRNLFDGEVDMGQSGRKKKRSNDDDNNDDFIIEQ